MLILGSVALPVPPPLQGGTERIAFYQAEGLAKRGYDVTLLAPRGSTPSPSYTLVELSGGDTAHPKPDEAVETSRNLRKEAAYLTFVSQWLLAHGKEYDVIVNNMRAGESIFLPIVSTLGKQMINVMHLPLFDELAATFRLYKSPIITISNAQRRGHEDLHYIGTAYNGVDVDVFQPPGSEAAGALKHDYLLMMGTVVAHKNQAGGIRIAKEAGKKLVIAGKIGNQAYFDRDIAPHIDGVNVEYQSELAMDKKIALYQGAFALLMPVLWEEPFGLVMIEAMACGTPVVAFDRGAIAEVVEHGKTGFVVSDEAAMVAAIANIGTIDRVSCRQHVEKHFSIDAMIDSYEQAIQPV